MGVSGSAPQRGALTGVAFASSFSTIPTFFTSIPTIRVASSPSGVAQNRTIAC